jgi:hypothetical protein
VIIAIVIAILFIRKRRKNKDATRNPDVPEMGDQNNARAEGKSFFGGKWRNEAHDEGVQNELDSKTVHIVPGPPAELDSTVVGASTEHGALVDNEGRDASHPDPNTR